MMMIFLLDGIASDRCDQRAFALAINCDSENLSSLTNISFSSEIETLSLTSNSLTLQSGRLILSLAGQSIREEQTVAFSARGAEDQ